MDLLGLSVAEARRRLQAAGQTEITEQPTAPPRGPLLQGEDRVVQQRTGPAGEVILVTARFPVIQDPQAGAGE